MAKKSSIEKNNKRAKLAKKYAAPREPRKANPNHTSPHGGEGPVRAVELGHGQLLALHADGGESPGTYIGSITLPIPD